MTGPELKQLRHDLGEAIGRRLSLADMAKICGLAPANGADTWRKWEDGAGPSGPVAALLSIFKWASLRQGAVPIQTNKRFFYPGGNEINIDAADARAVVREVIIDEIKRRLDLL
jgi:hypothetical protein